MVLGLALAGCGRTAPYWYTPDGGEEFVTNNKVDKPTDAQPFLGCDLNELVLYPLPPAARLPIDVLFMVDDSPSMADDQQILATNFISFIKAFETAQIDFHLGAVTSDMTATNRKGQLVAPFLTPETPNLEDAFKAMVNVGDKGSSKEQGISAAMAALTEPLSTGVNKGFIRENADFALIFLTDENDSSPQTINQAVDFFKTFKSDPESITVAAILDFGGSLFCGLGAENWKYSQLVHAFGAHGVLAVCNNGYSKTLETIGGRIVNSRCSVALKRPITDMAKVRITINGQLQPVVFNPPDQLYPNGSLELALCPPEGGNVEIEYLDCP